MGVYTSKNVLEAVQYFALQNYGYAPLQQNMLLPEGCSLANGKRHWLNIRKAFTDRNVEGAEEFKTFTAFLHHHGYTKAYPKHVVYTVETVIEAMKLHAEKNDNVAPTKNSGVILGDCALANGKRTWHDAYMSFIGGNVLGTEETNMQAFAKEHGFIIAPINYSMYEKDNVLLAMQEYADKNQGYPPNIYSGIIEGTSLLADGKRTWEQVHEAFYLGRVMGVNNCKSMSVFAAQNDFNLTGKDKSNVIRETAPNVTLRDVFFAVATEAVKVIAAKNVADDTAEIDLTDESLKKSDLNVPIASESKQNPLMLNNYTWSMLKTAIKKGLIPEIDKDFCLTTYAVEVEDRLLNGNVKQPTLSEVQSWAAPKLLKSA